jgi:hypothetical protein
VQFSAAAPLIAPKVACTVLVPEATQFTACDEASAPNVATATLLLDHMELLVTSCDDASLYFPSAVNAVAEPLSCVAVGGVTAMDTSVGAALHVSVALPLTAPTAARITLVPATTQLNACVVESAPSVATAEFPLDHSAAVVTSCEDPSLYVPVAETDTADPASCDGAAGITAIDISVGIALPCAAGPDAPCRFQLPPETDCPAAESTSATANRNAEP